MAQINTLDGMKYTETPVTKKVSTVAVKRATNNNLNSYGTSKILWHLVMRHKLVLSLTLNALFIVNWALPEWANILKSIL